LRCNSIEQFILTAFIDLQLSFNILSVLRTKQFAYVAKKLLYVKWKPKTLRTGVGRSKMTCGKCFGIAATQSYARKTKTIALAPATEFSLATTLRKLLATLSTKYSGEVCSHYV
jgi:hypothetical protein